MLTLILKNIPQKIYRLLCVSGIFFFSLAFAQEQIRNSPNRGSEFNLTPLQVQARAYRNYGYNQQNIGNLGEAMAFYQKATELDPTYGVAFNDLGVIYEAKGMEAEAEKCYLKAIKIEPNFLSAYSNLALLYENQRRLDKAVAYWEKRVSMGSPEDPWTNKAKARLRDIMLISGGRDMSDEEEIFDLMQQINAKKAVLRESNKELAKEYLRKARISYNREDYATALKLGASAQQLSPDDSEITEFVEKAQVRALSR